MSQWSETPPQLCSMSQCDSRLDFSPAAAWPAGLPAVAVNQIVLAGFSQELVFNHQVDPKDHEKISALFRSLYFELSFAEISRLVEKAKSLDWFPVEAVISKFGWQPTEQFFRVSEKFLSLPVGFQKWCLNKKVSPQDLAPLLSAEGIELKYLLMDILDFQLSKSMGVKALELGVELLLLNQKPEHLHSSRLLTLIPKDMTAGEAWLEALRHLRFPETSKRDMAEAEKWTSLPWPGTSQAKFTRHGDKGGIELKLFVSHPSDLKKYLQSLSKVQDLLEKDLPSESKH